ncbi:formylglycine-generating enzyme family protein [Thermodesulfobacteriota bacterium]
MNRAKYIWMCLGNLFLLSVLFVVVTGVGPCDMPDDDCIMCETTSECSDVLGEGWVCMGGCCEDMNGDDNDNDTDGDDDNETNSTTTTTTDGGNTGGDLGLSFVSIPGGSFQMGCSGGDDYCNSMESPQHTVTISSFKISAYEVTQGQWEAVIGSNPSYFDSCGSDCPVEEVTWNDVHDFIKALNSQTGKNYRLPTEAEWEYAARADTATEWLCGNDERCLDGIAWFDENSNSTTHPVGQKTPNDWGLYDMSGNVWEWVSDWYDSNYYDVSPSTDPQGPPYGADRVLRGCGWGYDAGLCRSAFRLGFGTSVSSFDIGFRLVLP